MVVVERQSSPLRRPLRAPLPFANSVLTPPVAQRISVLKMLIAGRAILFRQVFYVGILFPPLTTQPKRRLRPIVSTHLLLSQIVGPCQS
jgi:hypothetical protein